MADEEQRHEAAQRRDLREREIDEDHLARDHVQAEVGQHGDEHHTGDEWWQHQLEAGHGMELGAPNARPRSLIQRVTRSK